MIKRIILLLLIPALLAVSLPGCGRSRRAEEEQSAESEGLKTFVLGDTTFNAENGEPDINPHNSNSGWACIRYGVGETLFRLNDQMEIEPWLAAGYENVDELTWKITLRAGITFTSGRSLDGEAVKECLEALIENHARAAGDLHIREITASGQDIIIRTEIPVPALIQYLTDPYGCIYDVQAGVTKEGIVQGTGPYRAVSLTTDSGIELVKNENYWDGEPKIDRIMVRTISDGDTLTMALQSGEIDAAYGLPYISYPFFENENYNITACATSRAFLGAMNFESEIAGDPAVRKAIAMGIDKESFAGKLLGGNGYAAAGAFPGNFSFGGDVVSAEEYDPEGAMEVLEEAGWRDEDGDGVREKDGTPLVLRVLAESAQATLGEIGFQVEIINTSDHNRVRMDSGAWDIYVSAFVTAPTGDPEYFFTYRCLDESDGNYGHYHSDRLEELARELAGTFDIQRRGELAVEMQQTILDDNAFVFCAHLRMGIVSKASVTGLTAHPCDYYEITVDLDITEED